MSPRSVATTGGVRLTYEVKGDVAAPPMVLLHALGDRGSDWAPVADRFAEFSRLQLGPPRPWRQ